MATIEEIKRLLGNGDYVRIGKKVGVTRQHARVLLDRPNAKRHKEVVNAAEEIYNFYKEYNQ